MGGDAYNFSLLLQQCRVQIPIGHRVNSFPSPNGLKYKFRFMNTNDNTDDNEIVPNEGAVEFIFEIYWVTLSEGIE